MERELPKPVRKQLRVLADRVHEAAVNRALAELDREFENWRRGEIDAFDLLRKIHRFYVGPNREIYNRFSLTSSQYLPMQVAYGVAEALIEKSEIPAEVWPLVERCLPLYVDEEGDSRGGS